MSLSSSQVIGGSQQGSKLNLLDVLQRYPIFDRLREHLHIGEVINLTRTCKALSCLYQTLVGHRNHWNVDRDLLRFVRNPRRFREVLGKCDALISGSFALQFFERILWEGSDLDIFVESGQRALELEKHLVNIEGYRLSRETSHVEYHWANLLEIRTLRRAASKNTKAEQVQIVACGGPPLQSILRSFHSSIVINFLTWNKAYAVFPLSTFVRHNGFALRKSYGNDEFYQIHAEKYEKREYRIKENFELATSGAELSEIRRPGDHLTWKISLDTTHMNAPKTPDSVIEHSTFKLIGKPAADAAATVPYKIAADTFESCVLQYRYISPLSGDFFESIRTKLDQMTSEELKKLPEELRPPNYDGMIQNPRGAYHYRAELLDGGLCRLKCYDDQIAEWYAQWERRTPRLASSKKARLLIAVALNRMNLEG